MDGEQPDGGGWVKMHRKLFDGPIFQHAGMFRLWLWCLAQANWKDGKTFIPGTFKTIEIKRGQFITGRFALREALYGEGNWTAETRGDKPPCASTVWRWLTALRDMGCVELENLNNRCTMVTIVNYSTYQQDRRPELTTSEQPANNQLTTSEQPANNQLTTSEQPANTPKERNNSKKGRKKEGEEEVLPSDELDSDFSREWETMLPEGEYGDAIRSFVEEWNGTNGTQAVLRPADLGNLASLIYLLNDPAWKINFRRALQKFPLPYFEPHGMHVLKFLNTGTVETVMRGGYDFVPKEKADAAKYASAKVLDIHEGLEDIFDGKR